MTRRSICRHSESCPSFSPKYHTHVRIVLDAVRLVAEGRTPTVFVGPRVDQGHDARPDLAVHGAQFRRAINRVREADDGQQANPVESLQRHHDVSPAEEHFQHRREPVVEVAQPGEFLPVNVPVQFRRRLVGSVGVPRSEVLTARVQQPRQPHPVPRVRRQIDAQRVKTSPPEFAPPHRPDQVAPPPPRRRPTRVRAFDRLQGVPRRL